MKGRKMPVWLHVLLLLLSILAVCVALFIGVTLITDWANGLPAFTSVGDIWFAIFPSLKKVVETTPETVPEIVEPIVEAII